MPYMMVPHLRLNKAQVLGVRQFCNIYFDGTATKWLLDIAFNHQLSHFNNIIPSIWTGISICGENIIPPVTRIHFQKLVSCNLCQGHEGYKHINSMLHVLNRWWWWAKFSSHLVAWFWVLFYPLLCGLKLIKSHLIQDILAPSTQCDYYVRKRWMWHCYLV